MEISSAKRIIMIESLLLISIGIASRLLPHPANFTAVGGLALFTGARIGFGKGFMITIITMLMSDALLGFHSVMWATYGSMALGVYLGYLVQNRSYTFLAIAVVISSLQFCLITNFAVWLAPNTLYPKTFSGLIECYVMALPFFRNSLLGDVVYTTVFFTVAELIRNTKKISVINLVINNLD